MKVTNTIMKNIYIASMFLLPNAYASQNVKYYEIEDNNSYTLIAQTEDTDSSYIPLDKRFWREFNGGQQHLMTCNLKNQSSFVALRDKPSSIILLKR